MKVLVGKYSGFCAGVNYTYEMAKKEVLNGKIYCLGEIIHNELVINELENLGMMTINKITDIPDNSRVIFRAHGEPLSSYIYAKEHNLDVVDLTCGRVKLIHNKVLKAKDNYFIIIIGKKKHPEIIGTVGFCSSDYYVIETSDDIALAYESFIKSGKKKVYVISQTTFSSILFDNLCEVIKNKYKNYDIKIDKSICDATEKRQKECIDISKNSSIVLVVGSKNSSNTKELYDIAKDNCKNVFFIEKVDDIKSIKFKKNDSVGIVAGASAPRYLIDDIERLINSTCL